jgi:hypothetical protein
LRSVFLFEQKTAQIKKPVISAAEKSAAAPLTYQHKNNQHISQSACLLSYNIFVACTIDFG